MIALGNVVMCYSDDMICWSNDEDHAGVLDWIVRRLLKCNIQASPTKAFLGRDRVHFLGHYVDKEGLHVDMAKVDAIRLMPSPVDPTGIKRFLGCSEYYRKFIPDFGSRTASLTDLLHKTAAWTWGDKEQAEFDDIKQALSTTPILALPRWDLPFTLRTDASEKGIGAVLCQTVDGVRRIIACASRKWSPCELNWDVRRKECFATIYGVRKFKQFLQGSHFTLETDHRNLLWLQKVDHHTQQLYRWALELSTLDFTVKHVPGASLMDADCLSRAPLPAPEPDDLASDDWTKYEICASNSTSDSYSVFCMGCGLSCDAMATVGTPFSIVGGLDSDPISLNHFAERTNASTFTTLDELSSARNSGAFSSSIDVLALTLTVSLDEQLAAIELLKPRLLYVEVDPPTLETAQREGYADFEKTLVTMGYSVHARLLDMARHGAYVASSRYVIVATPPKSVFQFPPELETFPGCQGLMLDPLVVPPPIRAQHFTPTRRFEVSSDGFRPRQLGTVSRGDGTSTFSKNCTGVFDPAYPMPQFSDEFTWNMNKGSQWVHDSLGARQWTLNEECDLHNLDDTAKCFLHKMIPAAALGYISRCFPVAPLAWLYRQFLDVLQPATSAPIRYSDLHGHAQASAHSQFLSAVITHTMPSLGEVRDLQRADGDLLEVILYHEQGRRVSDQPKGAYRREAPFTHLEDGILYYRAIVGDDENFCFGVVLPQSLRTRVIQALHDSEVYAHPGIRATLRTVRQHAYWKGMSKDIRDYINNCSTCKRAKTEIKAHSGHQVTDFFYMPWQRLGVDLIGPFPGGESILHFICWATSFNYIVIVENKLAATVAAATFKFFQLFGEPEELLSDNGTEFVNGLMKALLTNHGVKHVKATPMNPQGNSRTERRHRDYNRILRIVVQKYGLSWKTGAFIANWCLNSLPRSGSSICPFEMLLGYKPRFPAESTMTDYAGVSFKKAFGKANLSDEQLMLHLEAHRAWCMQTIEQVAKEQLLLNKQSSDLVTYELTYSVGDLVLLARPVIGSKKKGTTTRLLFQNIGPFEVMEYIGNNAYRLRKLGTDAITTHNVKYMNPYLTKAAHEKQTLTKADPDANTVAIPAYVPQPGDFMLFVGLASSDVPFHLVEVLEFHSDSDDVEFYYWNNSTSSGMLRNYRPVWSAPDSKEIQSMSKPPQKNYVKVAHTAHRDYFCWSSIPVVKTTKGFHLSQRNINRVMRMRTSESYLAVSAASYRI